MQGGDTLRSAAAGIPNITGGISVVKYLDGGEQTGAFVQTGLWRNLGAPAGTLSGRIDIDLDASRCSPVFGKSDTVQAPALQLIPQFKI